MNKQKDRLVELLQEASTEAGKYFRETTKKVLAEKGRFNSKEDIDHRNIYEVEADYLLSNGVIVPPCKVGDAVWCIVNDIEKVLQGRVRRISVSENFINVYCGANGYYEQVYTNNEFEEKVFPSKEEAEAKLKEGVQG